MTERLPRIGDDPRAVVTATDPAISAYLEGRNAARPRAAPALTWDQAERELLEVARASYCTRAGDQITTRYRSRRRAIDALNDRLYLLRDEALAAGDVAQVALCDAALGGDAGAYDRCIAALGDAEAAG